MLRDIKYIKVGLIIILLLFPCKIFSYTYISYGIDGYWSSWKVPLLYEFDGTISNFVIYADVDHPSVFLLRVKINNYIKPTKDEIKKHLKNDDWFKFYGTVEYWVCDEYPTIKEVFKRTDEYYCKFVHNPSSRYSHSEEGRKVKRTAQAIIKTKCDKKGVIKVISIFFDDIGFCMSWGDELLL